MTNPALTLSGSGAARRRGELSRIGLWRLRFRARRDLARLLLTSDHLLDDLGLDRTEAKAESAKPFWRG